MAESPAEIQSTVCMTVAACRRRGWMVLGVLAVVLLGITAALTAAGADLKLAGRFYDPARGWFLGNEQPWQWFYRYGTLPGLAVTLAALAGWFAAKLRRDLAAWRPYCLLVVLTAVITSGILVNAVLKQYWGRPRPDQTTDFGGQWTYRDVHQPGTPGQGASFPSGHAAMGFTLVSLFFVHRRSKLVAYAGGGAGLALGGMLSATRIVQGAHFLTDTLWSLGLNLLAAAALYYLVLAIPAGPARAAPPVDRRRRIGLIAGLIVCLVLVVGAFSTRRPFYHSYPKVISMTPETKTLIVLVNVQPERFNVHYRKEGPARVRLDAHGFGWMRFDHRVSYSTARAGRTLVLEYRVDPVSYFAELDHAIDLQLPEQYRGQLTVKLEAEPGVDTPEKNAL